MNLLITGVSTYLGQAVVRRLIRQNPFKRVFGLGRKAPKVLGPVRFLPVDPRSDDLTDLLVMNDIQVVLHLAYAMGTDGMKDELAVAQQLIEVGALAGVERLVFASSDRVYQRGEGLCAEGAPCRGAVGAAPEVAGKAAVEAELA
ncbi:MAG: NAD-dependent epimerase/dehydratase family protein, partial [Myxococcales bacterium]|nr:NAD-dependent epimerase/dehydratase family protein [Myxococcales bacterium]